MAAFGGIFFFIFPESNTDKLVDWILLCNFADIVAFFFNCVYTNLIQYEQARSLSRA